MKRFLYPTATVALLIVCWQLSILIFDVPKYLVPSPLDTVRTMLEDAGVIAEHARSTLSVTLLGFAISVTLASLVASLVVASSHFRQAVYPLLASSQMVPKLAVAPLFLVWFGFGIVPKLLIVVMESFFPIVIAMVVGLVSVERETLHMLRGMGCSTLQEFVKVRFPTALPSIFGGLKVGMSLAIIGAIVGEFVASNKGLGYMLVVSAGQLNTARVFAGVLVLLLMGSFLIGIISLLERQAIPWYTRSRTDDLKTVAA